MKALNSLVRFYGFDSDDEFFHEMMNCLETENINKDNYEYFLKEFERSYTNWIKSQAD